jgi:glycosyltransferase involved in cell wall biosynthesis
VDDASADKSQEIARVHGAKLIVNPYKTGRMISVRNGIRNSTGDYVIVLSADGSNNPFDIPKLIETLEDYDLVIGSYPDNDLMNRSLSSLASYLTGYRVKDIMTDFFAVRKELIIQYLSVFDPADIYGSLLAPVFITAGYTVKYEMLSFADPQMMNNVILKHDKKDLKLFFRSFFKMSMLLNPMKIFIPMTLTIFISGLVLMALNIFIMKNISIYAVLLLITSLFTFISGLISDQVAHVRRKI